MPERELEKKEHQVFISYCNENSDKAGSDREIADRICSALESANISCWIDHRDIIPGENWVNAMFNAVEGSKLLVLVFSANTNHSQWVQDEITYALDKKIRIIPFRVDNVSPEGVLRVLQVRCHWIDARQPLQQKDLNRLVGAVRNHLEKDKEVKSVTTTEPPVIENPGNDAGEEKVKVKGKVKHPPWLKWGLVVASIIVLVVFYIIFLKQSDPSSPDEIEQQEQSRQNSVKESIPIEKKIDLLEEKKEVEKKNRFEQPDNLAYKTAENKNTVAAYQEYLEKYPSGKYVNEAKERIEKLEEMPEDVRTVASKASKGIKVEKNANGFWEADHGDGIIMVYIPAGTFTMGSEDGASDEKPRHQVSLDGYWMGKYEVTLAQYKAFISDKSYESLPSWVSKYSPMDDHPVIGVSWHDALEYCQWLSDKKGINFKLPTEAQWEKAARGTDSREYPWGDDQPDEKLANFGENISKTTRVGTYSKGASPYGLLDMAGNVWEWCNDWYDSNYYKSSPGKNPKGPESGSYRVVRGGGWNDDAGFLRCANRFYVRPSRRGNVGGFRLCQDN